jgi:hypothetical protein
MPKVKHIKKARRALPQHGIQVGDSYYQWSRMVGGRGVKFYSKEFPKRQQLTGSEFFRAVYDIEDRIQAVANSSMPEAATPYNLYDDVSSEIEEIISDIQALADEQNDKRDNMPQGLQDGQVGELLQNRYDSCTEWASEIEGIDLSNPEDEEMSPEDLEEHWQSTMGDLYDKMYQGE